MSYPRLFIVRLIGQEGILGVCMGFDEDEAKKEIGTITGWPFDGLVVSDEGDISEVPKFVT